MAANPYVGPRPFVAGERIYGRDRELATILSLLIAERLLLLYSPSGAGKTSLIQAALIDRLVDRGFRVLPPIRVNAELPSGIVGTPGEALPNRYVFSMLSSLESGLAIEPPLSPQALAQISLADYFSQRIAGLPDEDIVLIYDQFEEVITADPANQAEKFAFFAQLDTILRNHDNIWALFSMREDFLASLDPYTPILHTRLKNTFRLDLLGTQAARAAVNQPAALAGVSFDDDAVEALIDDLRHTQVQRLDGTIERLPGPYIEPVQLQVVCLRLWENLPPGTTHITRADVQAIGNVDTALADYYAENVIAVAQKLGISERRIRDWFEEHLITDQGIRGQVLQGASQSQGLDNAAIYQLIDAHLVRAEKRYGATWFELSHDRLIAPVRSNNEQWRDAHLSRLQRQATLWGQQQRPDSLLLHNDDLREAEAWAQANPELLNELEQHFLQDSQAASVVVARERRRNRLVRFLAVGASLFALVALALAATAFFNYDLARQETKRADAAAAAAEAQRVSARARELTVEAQNRADDDPQLGLLLALEAAKLEETPALLATFSQIMHNIYIPLEGHTARVNSAAFSPDGQSVATVSDDKTVRVWDVKTGKQRMVLEGHTERVWSVAFSPDSTRIVTSSTDQTARIWDAASGKQLLVIKGHQDYIKSVAYSPDGKHIVTASYDATVRIWDADKGDELLVLRGHEKRVYSVAYSPDGTRIASAGQDQTVRIWDAASGNELHLLKGHTSEVFSVAFSPDGKKLVTASQDASIHIWDAASGTELRHSSPQGIMIPVISAVYSPDGHRILTSGYDNTARITNAESGEELRVFFGHQDAVMSAVYSPDGQRIVTASVDGSARIWPLQTMPEKMALKGHEKLVNSVAYSPDGKRIVTASVDNTARVWDAQSGKELLVLRGHKGIVNWAVFSPDGRLIATAGNDKTARIWDAQSGAEIHRLNDPEGIIFKVFFSPDGKHLVTSNPNSKTPSVWNVETGTKERELPPNQNALVNVAFSPDGKSVVATGDQITYVRNFLTGSTEKELKELLALDATYSPNGLYIATGGIDQRVRVWDAITGEQVLLITGLKGWVYNLIYSPDGKFLTTLVLKIGPEATLANPGVPKGFVVTMWDAQTGRSLAELYNYDGEISWGSLAYSPDRSTYAVAGMGNEAHIINADLETIKTIAAGYVIRDFTCPEREFYGLDAQKYPQCQAEILVREGHELARAGNVDAARAKFEQARALNPKLDLDPSEAANAARLSELSNQASALLAQSKYAEAVAVYSQTIELAPNTAKFYERRGWAWQSLGSSSYAAALADFDRAIELDPRLGLTYDDRGMVLSNQQKYSEAITSFSKMIELDPDNSGIMWTYQRRGNAYYYLKDYDAAIADYDRAIEKKPDSSVLYNSRGNAYYNKGDKARAIEDYSQAIGVDSTYSWGYHDRGKTLMELGKFDQGLSDVRTAAALDPTNDTFVGDYCTYGLMVGQAIRHPDILRICERVIVLNPSAGRHYHRRSIARILLGDTAGAIADWQRYVPWVEQTFPEEQQGDFITHTKARLAALEAGQAVSMRDLLLDNLKEFHLPADDIDAILQRLEIPSHTYLGTFKNETAQKSGAVSLLLSFEGDQVTGYINFDNYLGESPLCGAGEIRGTLAGDATSVSFLSKDFDFSCVIDTKFNFKIDILFTSDRSGLSGKWCINGQEQCGTLQAQRITDYPAYLLAQMAETRGDGLARKGSIAEAIEAFKEAGQRSPSSEIAASSWNTLCWNGTTWGHAEDVADACEQAIKVAERTSVSRLSFYRDSHGLNQAVRGNYAAAVEDFQAFIAWAQDSSYDRFIPERKAWIEALKAGNNPFDEKTLVELRNE